jgi:hypothetical protein
MLRVSLTLRAAVSIDGQATQDTSKIKDRLLRKFIQNTKLIYWVSDLRCGISVRIHSHLSAVPFQWPLSFSSRLNSDLVLLFLFDS